MQIVMNMDETPSFNLITKELTYITYIGVWRMTTEKHSRDDDVTENRSLTLSHPHKKEKQLIFTQSPGKLIYAKKANPAYV